MAGDRRHGIAAVGDEGITADGFDFVAQLDRSQSRAVPE